MLQLKVYSDWVCYDYNITHLLSPLLRLFLLRQTSLLLFLQSAQQLLAYPDCRCQLGSQLVCFLHQGVAQQSSGGLRSIPLLQRSPQPLDLLVLLMLWLEGEGLQLPLLLSQLLLQPLDLLWGERVGRERDTENVKRGEIERGRYMERESNGGRDGERGE